ncbi:MAG TPA: DUF4276 family protein [Thermoanaerobaculia bacterium]|nr:DUF4276 family protein [Thermoanaerobaculia bacterium]
MGKECARSAPVKRVLILVEGQTEERFVKDVLAPAFVERQVFLSPTILVTKRVKDGPNFKGGVTNYAKFRADVRRLLQSSSGALVLFSRSTSSKRGCSCPRRAAASSDTARRPGGLCRNLRGRRDAGRYQ